MSVETGKKAEAAQPLESPDPDTEASGAAATSSDTVLAETVSADTAETVSADTEAPSLAQPPASEQEPEPGRSLLARIALAASIVLVVLALVAAGWFGTAWVRAAFTDGPRADARDTALDAARQAALNLTSMNVDDVPGSLALARSSMTGALLDSANKNKDQSAKLATESATNMQAKVLGGGLTSLDSERDKASALVVLQVTETGRDKPPADYRYTWDIDVTKEGDIWKAEQISSLGQPVLLSGGAQAAPGAQEGPQAPADSDQAPEQQPAAPQPGS
ncbi:hypothetical protein [Nocardia callitridis]|uniref:Mce-associated membrane protein n=1 Tax=Nocardia callitridis TaxID=648753 RepID=A0ABP9JWV4_9NOCA